MPKLFSIEDKKKNDKKKNKKQKREGGGPVDVQRVLLGQHGR